MKKKLIGLLALGLFSVGSAHAGAAINVLGGFNFQNDSVSPAQTGVSSSAVAALSYGVTGEFGISPMMALEVGAISMGAKTKATTAAGSMTVSTRSTVIPVRLRFEAIPMLDFGVGGYYAILPNQYTVEDATITANGTFDRTGEKADYGLSAGARLKLPLAPLFKFVVDASYAFGLKDTDKGSGTEKTRAYALMGGVQIGF